MVHGWTKLNFENLPYPKDTIFNNDSYASVRQCNADYLSRGCYTDKRSNENTPGYIYKLIDSPLANIVFKTAIKFNVGVDHKDIVVILGVQWIDDSEPNSSSKSNRGLVLIKTVSFYLVLRQNMN